MLRIIEKIYTSILYIDNINKSFVFAVLLYYNICILGGRFEAQLYGHLS